MIKYRIHHPRLRRLRCRSTASRSGPPVDAGTLHLPQALHAITFLAGLSGYHSRTNHLLSHHFLNSRLMPPNTLNYFTAGHSH